MQKFCTSLEIFLYKIGTEARLHSGRLAVRITTGALHFSLLQIV
jgi:hypothetical protein